MCDGLPGSGRCRITPVNPSQLIRDRCPVRSSERWGQKPLKERPPLVPAGGFRWIRFSASVQIQSPRFRRMIPRGVSRGVGSVCNGVQAAPSFWRKSFYAIFRVDRVKWFVSWPRAANEPSPQRPKRDDHHGFPQTYPKCAASRSPRPPLPDAPQPPPVPNVRRSAGGSCYDVGRSAVHEDYSGPVEFGYTQTNLVSNIPGHGYDTDPSLVNPWDINFPQKPGS